MAASGRPPGDGHPGTTGRQRAVVAGVFAAGLLVRLALFGALAPDPRKFYLPDSRSYETLAHNLLHHGVFSGSAGPPFRPSAFRTPVYPAFLAAVFAVAGERPGPPVLVQTLLGALTAALTARLALWLGIGTAGALVGGLIVALDPVSVMVTNLLLTETLFVVLVVAGVGWLARRWPAVPARDLAGAALLLGLAGLTRPIAQFLPLALTPLLAAPDGRPSLRGLGRRGLPFLLVAALVMVPWALRNQQTTGAFAVSTVGNRILHWQWAASVLAEAEGISRDAAAARLRARLPPPETWAQWSQGEQSAFRRREALGILVRHPTAVVTVAGRSLLRLALDPGYTLVCTVLDLRRAEMECFPGRTMNEAGLLGPAWARFREMTRLQQGALVGQAALLGFTYLAAALGVAGLVARRRWQAVLLVGAPLGYLALVSLGPQAEPRFRVPLMPFLALWAGAGVAALARPRRRPWASTT